ncbi:hypothetical protein [Mesorhizobium sp. B1-1-8]|uniref:hypothetical protein n=1 Tax=Mesorhizobium sp. B1-1-8 TaxID=2589976 RepID=UPI00112B7068|nr:hypothetical protein [Mesorhizobium sp. B1-1-8]UCI05958.1 hypothetical protein FJ974_19250 [Mesorhizobium sp. B1-1-8]
MVIAEFSSIGGPKEPLPGPLRREADTAKSGFRLFAAVYAKQGSERQDIVRFLPGFRQKGVCASVAVGVAVRLDRLK